MNIAASLAGNSWSQGYIHVRNLGLSLSSKVDVYMRESIPVSRA